MHGQKKYLQKPIVFTNFVNTRGSHLLDQTSVSDQASQDQAGCHSAEELKTKTIGELVLMVLKEEIDSYSGSLSSLSHKSGVDPKTIRRISSLEYKRSPNADTVQRLLGIISKQRSVRDIANHYQGPIKEFLQKAFPHYFVDDARIDNLNDPVISKIKDIYSYFAVKILICYDQKGLNKNEFIEILTNFIIRKENELFENINSEDVNFFRPVAISKIKSFLKSELIIEDRYNNTFVLNRDQTKGRLYLPYEMCQKYEFGTFFFTEPEFWKELDYFTKINFGACSKAEAHDIAVILHDAFQKCREIISKSSSKEVPINIITSMETLNYHKESEVKK